MSAGQVSEADWWKLSLALRRRWWTETDYSRLEPGDQLQAAVRAALQEGTTMSGEPKPADPKPADPPPPPVDPPKPAEQPEPPKA